MSRKIAEENQQLIQELHCKVTFLADRLKDVMQKLDELKGFVEETYRKEEDSKVGPVVLCPLDMSPCVAEERCKEGGCVFMKE